MGHEAIAVADGLFGGILQAARGDPGTNCFSIFELLGHTGIEVQEFVKLLLRRHVGLGIAARIDGQTNTDKRISGKRIIVKGDDPEPAALETMVQCALVVGDRQRVMSVIKGRHIHHVGKQGARMMFQAGRILAQAETVGEDTLVSRAVDEIAGANFFPCRCLELYPLLDRSQRP